MSKKKKKSKSVGVLLIIAMSLTMIFRIVGKGGSQSVSEGHKNGYVLVDSIAGITFEVPADYVNKAQTASSLSMGDTAYLKDVWLIKDGTTYRLFEYDNFVIIAEKGTKFHQKSDTNTAAEMWIENASAVNCWFTPDEKHFVKSDVTNGADKTVVQAVSDVSINPQFYGHYAGRIAIIYDGQEEWTLFCGFKGETYKDLEKKAKDVLCHVVASAEFTGYDANRTVAEITPEEAAPTDEPQDTTSEDLPPVIITPDPSPTPTATPVPTLSPTPTATPVPTTTAAPTEEPKATDTPSPTPTVTPVPTATPTPTATPVPTSTPVPTATTAPTATPTPVKDTSLIDKAKNSSAASPLKVGGVSTLTVSNASGTVETYIRLDKIYERNEAKELVEKFMKDSGEEYPEPPTAQRWQVAEFTCGVKPSEAYVSSKLKDTDGGTLTYNGVKNEDKTYDAFGYIKQTDDGYTKFYIYYPIPNGKTSYMLVFGEGTNKAYFLIK